MTQTGKRQLSVRLTTFLAAVCTVFLLIGGAAGAEGAPPETTQYVVSAGDTLWEVAATHAGPDVDIRNLISEIRKLSGVESSTIYPGQILRIPRS